MKEEKTTEAMEENEQKELTEEEVQKTLSDLTKERNKKMEVALGAMAEGKGKLELSVPIISGDTEIKELAYDFTALTGMEYIDAMDSDPRYKQMQKITYRQGLALFAVAAAKNAERLDMQDIMERISAADAVEAVELATIFFSGSARAGRLRISKK